MTERLREVRLAQSLCGHGGSDRREEWSVRLAQSLCGHDRSDRREEWS